MDAAEVVLACMGQSMVETPEGRGYITAWRRISGTDAVVAEVVIWSDEGKLTRRHFGQDKIRFAFKID